MAGRPPLRIGQHGKITRKNLGGGIWLARCRFRDKDGKTRLVERRTPLGAVDEYGDKAEAELVASLDDRRPPSTASITGDSLIGALLDAYIERLRADGELAPRSIDTYAECVKSVRSRFAGLRVREMTAGRLDDTLAGIRKDIGYGRATHTKVLLNAVLTKAVLDGAIDTNPVRQLGRVKRPRRDQTAKGAVVVTAEQVRQLLVDLAASEDCRRKDLIDPITMLAATGIRRSELLALRPTDVDLDARVVTVSGSVVRVTGSGLIRQTVGKTDSAQREIPLPLFAVEMLRRRMAEDRPDAAGVIFASATGTLRDPDNFNKQWRDVRGALGVPDVSSHSFRKAVATFVDDAGLSARIAADQLGHSKVSQATDTYMSRRRVHTEVADVLDRVAAGKTGE